MSVLRCRDERRIICFITSSETELSTMAAELLSTNTGIEEKY